MSIVAFHSEVYEPLDWRRALHDRDPGLDFQPWKEVTAPEDVDVVLAWRPPEGMLASLPNLKLLQCLGAGFDQLRGRSDLDGGFQIARIIDDDQTAGMVEYALAGVLHFHRDLHLYRDQAARSIWKARPRVLAGQRTIGVLGLGAMGAGIVRALLALGFAVRGLSRTPASIGGMRWFDAGDVRAFADGLDIAICALSLNASNAGILGRRFFDDMRRGAAIINIGRGAHLVEADLLAALDSGQLEWARLDVTAPEPPHAGSPLWHHPRVELTPHVATSLLPRSVAKAIVENIHRVRAGLPPIGAVSRLELTF
jgi:glyoxylate/hydroxypyruvate reductase A